MVLFWFGSHLNDPSTNITQQVHTIVFIHSRLLTSGTSCQGIMIASFTTGLQEHCPTPPWLEHLYLTWTIHPCWYRAFELLLVQWSVTTKTSSGPLELALPWVCWTISFDETYQAFSQPKPQNCLYLCSPFPGVLCLVKGSH